MSQQKRILIIGGVAGGASAAARARRLSEDAHIIMFERGEHISFANCGLPYHIGEIITDRQRLLVQTPAAMKKRFNIEVRTRTEVTAIDTAGRQLLAVDLSTGNQTRESYDAVILSPGAEPIRPPIPGIDSRRILTLRSMADMDAIKHVVDKDKPARAVVVGGGYIGLEMAEALRARKLDVTLVELANQVFGPADPEMASILHQQIKLHGVDLRLGTSVTGFADEADGLKVSLSSGQTVTCGIAIMAIGVRPEVKLARQAGLKIGESGGIWVDENMRTSDPNIYAVGDAVEVQDFVTGAPALIPLAGPANRQGRIAADNIFGRPSRYRKTQGTSICKVFDLAVGMTGLSEKAIRRKGLSYEKVYVHPASHASYYPGASQLTLKLLFDPASGKILGAQAVGADGVDKRIDVLAVAMRAGMTVMDLQDLELSYAPPFGSAKDPINYAGFVASNVVSGDVKLCHAEDVLFPREDQLLLDVRMPAEVQSGTIPGSLNIPLDDLRDRLGQLPPDKEIIAFCAVGLRGYVACRILSQNGFRCRNLSGGYKTFAAAVSIGKPVVPVSQPKEMKDDTGSAGVAGPAPAASGGTAEGLPAGHAGETSAAQVSSCCSCSGATLATRSQEPPRGAVVISRDVDARGLQCPGPIMRLRSEINFLQDDQLLRISVTDPSFAADVAGWCHSTGNELVDVLASNGHIVATIRRKAAAPAPSAASQVGADMAKNKSIVVFSGDFDKAMAAFIIANGAVAMGSRVTMFFTFWGLNCLRRPEGAEVRKNLIERMFGMMMPRGAGKLKLSKMNMGGMGLGMIKGIMRKKHVAALPDLISQAQAAGVRLVACSMSMDLMGIKKAELIDGIEEGGVAMYLDKAEAGNVNLFI